MDWSKNVIIKRRSHEDLMMNSKKEVKPSSELTDIKQEYDRQVERLVHKIKMLDYVQDFQKAETHLMAEKELFETQEEMKQLQKDATLYQKIGKNQAYKETAQAAQKLEKKIKHHPIVEDYAMKLENVNDLVQYVTGQIEEKVNSLLKTDE